MNVVEQIKHADSLPLGHYGIMECRNNVDKEYARSRQTEMELRKRFPITKRHIFPLPTCECIANRICQSLGVRKIKGVRISNNPDIQFVSAWYSRGYIETSYHSLLLTTLLHELAHHIAAKENMGHGHNAAYCSTLILVWEAAFSIYKL